MECGRGSLLAFNAWWRCGFRKILGLNHQIEISRSGSVGTVTSISSFALGPLKLSPSASFTNTVTGAFTDDGMFNLGSPSIVAASLTNVEVSFGGPSFGGISGFSAWLNGMQLFGPTSTNTDSGFAVKTQVLSGGTTLPAGAYHLLVSGTAVSGASASYGGNLVATLVPEPETYAMLLAGLGAVGFLARRRKNG